MPHTISVDDPTSPDVLAPLGEHLADMYATSPAESVHALDPSALAASGITFWTSRDRTGTLLGCVAARRFYERTGFVECPPFADYVLDPHSVFYRLTLAVAAERAALSTGPTAARPAS